ncbi:MAG: response regulator [Alphaproteobacteria bacterium]|nr:response regulator [Alphaproteobacteria bacterium]
MSTGNNNRQKKSYSLHQFTILIAEDFPFMADLLSSMLREFGVGRIIVAENGRDAISRLRSSNGDSGSREPIDLALIDWLMPKQNGMEVISWIRSHKRDSLRFLPTILISAYTSEAVVEAGRDNGFNEVLVKPVSAEKLAQRILYVIDNPRPFVKAPNFFGPDRRRKDLDYSGEERRVTQSEHIKVNHER